MMKRLLRAARLHITENWIFYAVVLSAFVLGIIIGAVGFDKSTGYEMRAYISDSFTDLGQADNAALLGKSLFLNIILILVLFLSAISVAGCVAAPLAAAYKGFLIGYTLSVFYSVYGMNFFWALILGILPSAAVWFIPLVCLCVYSMKFSLYIVNCCRRKTRFRDDFIMFFIRFAVINLLCAAVFLISSLIDAYISPLLLNLAADIFIIGNL